MNDTIIIPLGKEELKVLVKEAVEESLTKSENDSNALEKGEELLKIKEVCELLKVSRGHCPEVERIWQNSLPQDFCQHP